MISFYHVENEEGKLAADPELKEALRLTGFRWKSMKNDPKTGSRLQLMAIKRPKEGVPDFMNPRKLVPGQEPITLKTGIMLELSKEVVQPDRSTDSFLKGGMLAP